MTDNATAGVKPDESSAVADPTPALVAAEPAAKPVKAAKVKRDDTLPVVVATCRIVGGEEKGKVVPAGKPFTPRSQQVFDSLPKSAWREPTEAEAAIFKLTAKSADELVG